MLRILFLFLFLAAPALGTPSLHPVPRNARPLGGNVMIDGDVRITGVGTVDPAAQRVLRDCLTPLVGGEGVGRIVVGTREDPSIAPLLKEVPEVSGAYRLLADQKRVVLAGHDARGTYYAARTLEDLLARGDGYGEIPAVDIVDWPEVPHRGIVEGFYGTPWPHEKRLRLIDFLGAHKLDTYIYGPKDDPYHSSPHWRDPYPEAEAAKIRELTERSQANHVDFYWAIHPGKDIKWNKEDEARVLAKFEAMYQLGVRAFAVFFDDISGEGTRADRQAELLNTLHREFVLKKGDVSPLVMCPTQYNKAWSGGDYLDTLGTTLDPAIHVMWTGNTVVADLDRPSMEWINAKLRRKAFIWWNNPVTDYVRNHLLMGPVYGNAHDIGPLYGGFVSNPMERSEASKVALFGVADYTWNPEEFDSEASFLAAMDELMPGAPDAFEVFCRHNSDLGPNGHGYRRTESVEFAPKAEVFLTALRTEDGLPSNTNEIRDELRKIAAAPEAIRKGSENPALIEEIDPWLDAFAQLGLAGVAGIDALGALSKKDAAEAWQALFGAHAALERMEEIDKTQNRNPHQPGIRTGSLVVTPLVRGLIAAADARLLALLSGDGVLRITGIASAKDHGSLPAMLDGKEDTYFYDKSVQQTGDWFGVNLGGIHEVSRLRIIQGRNDGDHDRVHRGVIETSIDGRKWTPLPFDEALPSRIDLVLDTPVKARQIRVRVTRAGVPGGKPDLWTAVREFEVNPEDAAELRSDFAAYQKLPVRATDSGFAISPSLEVHSFPGGAYLGLSFPRPVTIKGLEVDLKSPGSEKAFVLEASHGSREWNPLPTDIKDGCMVVETSMEGVAAIRLRNQGVGGREVTLAKFEVSVEGEAENGGINLLTDGSLSTFATVSSTALEFTPPGDRGISELRLLLGEGGGSCKVSAKVSGQWQVLEVDDSPFFEINLPKNTEAIRLQSASNQDVEVREMILSE